VNNGDSVEIQHKGPSNAVLDDVTRADLRDPGSANIKVLEAQNPSNGSSYAESICLADLRHERACSLLADGVDVRIIQLMLGHASIQQTSAT
jgi:integrase